MPANLLEILYENPARRDKKCFTTTSFYGDTVIEPDAGTRIDVNSAIDALPSPRARLIGQMLLENSTWAEIADLVGCSRSTIAKTVELLKRGLDSYR